MLPGRSVVGTHNTAGRGPTEFCIQATSDLCIARATTQTHLLDSPSCLRRGVLSLSSSSLTASGSIPLLSPAALVALALPIAATTAAWLATISPHIFPVPCTCTRIVNKQRLAAGWPQADMPLPLLFMPFSQASYTGRARGSCLTCTGGKSAPCRTDQRCDSTHHSKHPIHSTSQLCAG